MRGDIGLFLSADGRTFDLALTGADLSTEEGIATAVMISLFTDRRVTEEELPEGESSRRGWWGDLFAEESGDQIGSRLWLLAREKRTVETLNRSEEYSKEALQWMLEDGVANAVDCTASYDTEGRLVLVVAIERPGGKQTFRFARVWNAEASGKG